MKSHHEAFNVLLVDSEAPVKKSPREHLKSRDNWDVPEIDDRYFHLMVQTMEAWFIADVDTLKKFYGLKENVISRKINVENIDKDSLASMLIAATCKTSKGEYQKIKHAAKLLEMLNVDEVCKASTHCDRLFTTLTQIIDTLC